MTSIATLLTVAMSVYAESAPVYDADTMSQQFDNVGAGDPPMPQDVAPDSTFVPMQQPIQQMRADDPAASQSDSGSLQESQPRRSEQASAHQSAESSARVESLQGEVQTLRGQVELLTHQLEQLQAQQKNQFSDLDKRLAKQATPAPAKIEPVESKPAEIKTADADLDINAAANMKPAKSSKSKNSKKSPAAVADSSDSASVVADSTKSAASQPNVAEEQQIYQTAYNLIKAKKYNDAIGVLQGMLQKYPSGQFASNAHYWLGELYGLLGKNDQALTEFSVVVKTYPDSPRVSDAQLKVGLILASQFKWNDAKTALKKVVNRYPGTASARLATDQLKQIKQAGH